MDQRLDLSTTYLGIPLPNPLVVGASPLGDELDTVKQLEDAGAAAVVLRSLFEEQLRREQMADYVHQESHADSFAEAATYFPSPDSFVFGPEEYLNHLRRAKEAVHMPLIGSINGVTPGGWLSYGKLIEQAGADALELNVYHAGLDPEISGADIESQTIQMVRVLKGGLRIPVTVKLSPLYTSFAHFAMGLDRAGADGLVLFNRFYESDIDVQELAVKPTLHLSNSSELLLRLRGIAALAPRVKASLAVTGGVHTALDVVKSTMAGAHVTQMVSALLQNGPSYVLQVLAELQTWMGENDWSSLQEMRGNMSVERVPDPEIYARANYMMMLQSWEDV